MRRTATTPPHPPAQPGVPAPPAALDFTAAAQRVLQDLHDRVGLESWWVARRQGDVQVVLAAVDPVHGHGIGTVRSWEDSYCRQVVDGGAPRAAPRTADAPAHAAASLRNGLHAASLLAVPLVAPDGEVLGTLCAVSPRERPGLERHLATVSLQADVLGALLSHELRHADQVRRAERAERAAHTDALTGVANRRGWDAAVQAEESRAARHASPAAVLVADLDGLKVVNDTAGHAAGDALLRRTATVLGRGLREHDVLARLGGDEFAVLLPETDRAAAGGLAARLGAALAAEGVAVSLGVGARRGQGSVRDAWGRADAAMYAAKAVREPGPGAPAAGGPAAAPVGVALTAPSAPGPDPAAPDPAAPGPSAPSPGGPRPGTDDAPGRDLPPVGDVDALLEVVRAQLGADIAVVSAFEGDRRRFRNVASPDPLPFGPGSSEPRAGTYCQLLVEGVVPAVAPDSRAVLAAAVARGGSPGAPPRGAASPAGALPVGWYVGVPLRRRDGELYGTLCAVSRRPDHGLRERDAGILTAVAAAVMALVEAEDARAAQRADVLARLDRLHAGGGLELVYQPVLDLVDLRQVGVEALSRFPAGTPGPAAWFADATAAGAGLELELAAVAGALAALGRVQGFLAVNASAVTAASPGFARALAGAPLDRLVLEITEHEAVADYAPLTAALAPLRRGGLRVAVDDTGAGFASMRHVLALVPDLIKLDTSLVRDIDTDPARQALAAALTAFAGSTGALVVAEGVETTAELDLLRALGVHLGQGHHLARPGPLPSPV